MKVGETAWTKYEPLFDMGKFSYECFSTHEEDHRKWEIERHKRQIKEYEDRVASDTTKIKLLYKILKGL